MGEYTRYFGERPLIKMALDPAVFVVPRKWTRGAAGVDLALLQDVSIPPWSRIVAHSGVKIQLPPNFCGIIIPRSSFLIAYYSDVTIGLLDEDYRGEVRFVLQNRSFDTVYIPAHTRVCNLLFLKTPNFEIEIVTELEPSETRSDQGFGSTG